ncbi:MAG TPA: hypothetical protein VHE35_15600 [Kofleriaceae bacterium]|nr:hypothetical protein [Kofleriaceae bacterium]
MRRRLATSSALLVLGLAACGGKARGLVSAGGGAGGSGSGGGGDSDKLPWEATLTAGASWELALDPDLAADGDEPPVTVKVDKVDVQGTLRVYHLSWSDGGNGPTTLRVESGVVTINDAQAKEMKEPSEMPDGSTCYGQDFSNPDGCDDVCDADLCLGADGIVSVDGLYAPNDSMYRQQ